MTREPPHDVDPPRAHREAVRTRYGLPSPEASVRPREPAVRGPRFALAPPPVPGLRRLRRSRSVPPGSYLDEFQLGPDPEARVGVTVTEAASHADAIESLVDLLALSMAVRLPDARDRGADVGDFAFADDEDPLTTIWFVRGAIVFRVESYGRTRVAVAEIARAVDQQAVDHQAWG